MAAGCRAARAGTDEEDLLQAQIMLRVAIRGDEIRVDVLEVLVARRVAESAEVERERPDGLLAVTAASAQQKSVPLDVTAIGTVIAAIIGPFAPKILMPKGSAVTSVRPSRRPSSRSRRPTAWSSCTPRVRRVDPRA